MKNGLFLLGLTVCAGVVGTVSYLYRTDADVRAKVNEAAASVRELCSVVAERATERRAAQEQRYQSEVARNQQWAEEQWEAIGI